MIVSHFIWRWPRTTQNNESLYGYISLWFLTNFSFSNSRSVLLHPWASLVSQIRRPQADLDHLLYSHCTVGAPLLPNWKFQLQFCKASLLIELSSKVLVCLQSCWTRKTRVGLLYVCFKARWALWLLENVIILHYLPMVPLGNALFKQTLSAAIICVNFEIIVTIAPRRGCC